MARARTHLHPRVARDPRYNSLRVSTVEFTDWLKERAQSYSEKELADMTGLSLAGSQNLKQGRSGASGTTISTWCLNDPEFRMAYFKYVGGQIETDPGFATAMSQAIGAWMQARGAA